VSSSHTAPVREVWRAPAKINLWLEILGSRPDGYHDIDTCYQAIDLADTVVLEPSDLPGVSCRVEGPFAEGVPEGEENLGARAALLLAERTGHEPRVSITIVKEIPAGAGLGGGSSDAAATLKALDRLFDGAVPAPRLAEIAASLGSDVPFFLASTPLAIGRGRGELLEAVAPLPAAAGVVLMPPVAVATAEAYRALDERRGGVAPPPAGPLVAPRAWEHVAALAANDFEEGVAAARPDVAEALAALRATGPLLALLSGSGAACFALYRSQGAADEAARSLAGRGRWRVLPVRTLAAWPEPAHVPQP
jgi:4-diphosphocytidyl-2-C-methyl-D-erythritol kinase